MVKRKRLFYDIEVSPNIGFFWQPGHKIQISYENIIQERSIICICYKWAGEKKVSSLTWEKGCDKKMLKDFIKIANSADELIGHNSDKFDLTWIRTRCLYHNIPVFPNYTTIDTLKAARGKFRFNSNRLDYVGKFLGIGQKLHTGFDLWKGIVLDNDKGKMNKMVAYCKQDVRLLEAVFDRLNTYLPPKTSVAAKKIDCPECGGSMKVAQSRVTAAGIKKKQLVCKGCGKFHTIPEKEWLKSH